MWHCAHYLKDEINENRRKLKIMTHQIDQLKEEIQNKDQTLVKGEFFCLFCFSWKISKLECVAYIIRTQEHSKLQLVEKEKEQYKTELLFMKKEAAETKAYIDAQQSEERKLLKIIQEADAERSKQKKQLEQVRETPINIHIVCRLA